MFTIKEDIHILKMYEVVLWKDELDGRTVHNVSTSGRHDQPMGH
jgi:hypothetical protein